MTMLFIGLLLVFWVTNARAQAPAFDATPLTDFTADDTYLGSFSGFLYDGLNTNPTGSQHDLDGRSFAAAVHPQDINGLPSSSGKIVVVGLGMSNWTGELCTSVTVTQTKVPPCLPVSFIATATASPAVNHTSLVLVDCAANQMTTLTWTNDSGGLYTRCAEILRSQGLSEKQVQVVLWKNADPDPTVSLSSTTNCAPLTKVFLKITPDACIYEHYVAAIARYIKGRYPNVQQMFLHSRTYGGYATSPLSPEPYAYEYGFATKWLIQAQIDQVENGFITPVTGDLSYARTPWLAWGPYLWADGTSPRSDGLTWDPGDFDGDGTHPSLSGIIKVTSMLMSFYETSPYTRWFLAGS